MAFSYSDVVIFGPDKKQLCCWQVSNANSRIVVLTLCPPGPLEQKVSILISLAFISISTSLLLEEQLQLQLKYGLVLVFQFQECAGHDVFQLQISNTHKLNHHR